MLKPVLPRDIIAGSLRNSRGMPWTPGHCFGLAINETLPDVCRLQCHAPGSAAGGVLIPAPPAAPHQENER